MQKLIIFTLFIFTALTCVAQRPDTTVTFECLIIKKITIQQNGEQFYRVTNTRLEYHNGEYRDETIGVPIGKSGDVEKMIEKELVPDSTSIRELERKVINTKVKNAVSRRIAKFIRETGMEPFTDDVLLWEEEELEKIKKENIVGSDTEIIKKEASTPPQQPHGNQATELKQPRKKAKKGG